MDRENGLAQPQCAHWGFAMTKTCSIGPVDRRLVTIPPVLPFAVIARRFPAKRMLRREEEGRPSTRELYAALTVTA